MSAYSGSPSVTRYGLQLSAIAGISLILRPPLPAFVACSCTKKQATKVLLASDKAEHGCLGTRLAGIHVRL